MDRRQKQRRCLLNRLVVFHATWTSRTTCMTVFILFRISVGSLLRSSSAALADFADSIFDTQPAFVDDESPGTHK